MDSYGRQLEAHLRERGWLDRAFVYWFDEPSPDQYPFVMNGFAKLKRHAPGLTRMLTEQVEPGLVGGPNLWCPITDEYRPCARRRAAGAGREILVVCLHRAKSALCGTVHRSSGAGNADLGLADLAARHNGPAGLADQLLDQQRGLPGPQQTAESL